MKLLRPLVYGVGLAGLVAVLTPIWLTHHLATRVVGTRRRGNTIDISRIDARSASLDDVISAGQPVILEELVGEMGLSQLATADALRELAGDPRINVTEFDAARPYFLYSGGYDTIALE